MSLTDLNALADVATEERSKQKKRVNYFNLFLELAKPNDQGESRWVYATEWVGKYAPLSLGNGLGWGRKNSKLAGIFHIEIDRSITNGSSIDAIRLAGFK
jgi:hypothetical protein